MNYTTWQTMRRYAWAFMIGMILPSELIAEPLPLHVVWSNSYNRVNSLESVIVALKASDDGGAYLWCRTQPEAGGKEGTLVKKDSLGQTLWELHFAHESASNALPVDCWMASNRILVCLSLEFTNATAGIMTASVTKDGQLEWTHLYAGGSNCAAQSICQDATGGVAVAGTQQGDSLLIKLDGDGQLQWAQVRDGPYGGTNQWRYVRPGLLGEVYTLGTTYHPGAGAFVHLSYHSATGAVRWETSYFGTLTGALITDSGGNTYIGDASVVKRDPQGSNLWTVATSGGPPLLMQLTPDEQHLFYAGELRVSGKYRYHMAKLSVTGALEWARIFYNEINPPESWQPYAAAVDSSSFSYISGNRGVFLLSPDGDRYHTIPGHYRFLTAIDHNKLFAVLNPATIEYLSGFPAFSDANFGFYGTEAGSTPNEVRMWVPSKNGQVLQIEFAEDLMSPDWIDLPAIISTGLITEVMLVMTNEDAAYRLHSSP